MTTSPASPRATAVRGPPPGMTELLRAWGRGDPAAFDALVPLVYDELRRLARRALRGERPRHTLETTGLVHEAYLRLVGQRHERWEHRGEFYAMAAQVMRRILVDHARRRRASKRGGGAAELPVGDMADLERLEQAGGAGVAPRDPIDVLALDDALARLAARDPRLGELVELRCFGGLTIEGTADVLGRSVATVKRDWSVALAWLRRELRDPAGPRDGPPP